MSSYTPPPALDRPVRYVGLAKRPKGLRLPPDRMPIMMDWRLLKRWRYVAVWTSDITVYGASAWTGPVAQEFWAVWDRRNKKFYERTRNLIPGKVRLSPRGRMYVQDRTKAGDRVEFDVALEEDEGFEVVSPQGRAYTWTRKELIPARGTARINGEERRVEGPAFIDDNAGYHARRTRWKWCGGVGTDERGRAVGWNLIVGLNDTPGASENTLWIDRTAHEVGPVTFAPDLSSVTFAEGGTLHFHQETTRKQLDNFIVLRSDYEQPLGTFTGTFPDVTSTPPRQVALVESYGVMERQDALW